MWKRKNRSWCSSSNANDQRAITIEVASDTKEPYTVTDRAYNALIELVADICRRNGIKKLVWSTDKNKRMNHLDGCNMTVHRDYANKSCPGTYLYERHGDIAAKVNAKLGATTEVKPEPTPEKPSAVKVGGHREARFQCRLLRRQGYPRMGQSEELIVREVVGDRAVIDKSQDGRNAICSPVNTKYLTVVNAASTPPETA